MKKTDKIERIETYETGYENFLVDLVFTKDAVEKEDMVEAWLYREDMGIKESMFGVLLRQVKEFGLTPEEMVESNLANEDYYESYDERFH